MPSVLTLRLPRNRSATSAWRITAMAAVMGAMLTGCGGPAPTTKVHLTSDGSAVSLVTTRLYAITWKVTPPAGYTDCTVDIALGPPGIDGAQHTPLVKRAGPTGGDGLTGSKTLQLSAGDHTVTAAVLGVPPTPAQPVVAPCTWSLDINPG